MLEKLEQVRLRLKSRKALYEKVFNTPEGRLILADLVDAAHFIDGHVIQSQPEMLRHVEGRRWIVSRILNHLNLDSEALFKIYQEGKKI